MGFIENRLDKELEDIAKSNNFGLYHGKMGLAIVCLMQARFYNDRKATKEAKRLLKDVTNNIGIVEGFSFCDGLLGIGWAVEYIAQNKLLRFNTDEILSDLDSEIYKLIMFNVPNNLSLETGLLGRMLYLYKRVTSKNKNGDFYLNICNKECLSLTIDELHKQLILNETSILNTKLSENDEKTNLLISQCLVMVAKLEHLNLSHLVTIVSKKIISRMQELLTDVTEPGQLKIKKNMYVINALYKAGMILGNDYWIDAASSLIFNWGVPREKSSLIFEAKNQFSKRKEVILSTLQISSVHSKDYSWQEAWLLK